jgi:uncharacterized protein (UPF0262 family)
MTSAERPADHRISAIDLDERTIVWRNADVEQERRVAIFDLLEGNSFRPVTEYAQSYAGPYKVKMRLEEGRLAMDIQDAADAALESVVLPLSPFRRIVRDYFAICDSYYQAIRESTPSQIETVDMARRAIHNEAAELLQERLESKVVVDFDTARRLFTLLCVLHIKGIS